MITRDELSRVGPPIHDALTARDAAERCLEGESVRRVAVSSIGRGVGSDRASGYLRIVDLERNTVTFKVAVPESRWRAEDPNPRGGTRGARGIAVYDDRFVLGTHEDITVLDSSWRLVQRFSHPILSSVHDVLANDRGIWVACTRGDSVGLFDWDGQLVDWWALGTDPQLAQALGLHLVRPFDPADDYRDPRIDLQGWSKAGVNGLGYCASGVLVSLGRVTDRRRHRRFPFPRRQHPLRPPTFAIAELPAEGRLRETAAAIRLHRRDHPVEAPNHNPVEDGGLLLYNDSNRNALVAWDAAGRQETCSVAVPGDPPYARGLAKVGHERWLVGSQRPLAMYEIDVRRAKIVGSYHLEGGEEESVYAICPLPERFEEPQPQTTPDPHAFWAQLPRGVTPISD